MKKIQHAILLLLVVMAAFLSCKKKEYSLAPLPDKSQINMEVKQDLAVDAGGNTVLLNNLTQGIVPVWDYGTGKSNKQTDTIRFAFKGDYIINRTAVTGGGLVQLDPVTVKVTADNLSYVNDSLWNLLSGGPGKEKTWVLDFAKKGFDGPLFFFGTNNGWQGECTVPGGDCWNWSPGYAENTWLMPAGDYGSMTFSLKGGPYIKVVHKMIPARGTENGTYFLDRDKKTLTINDAAPLHDLGRDACVSAWGTIKLFSLTETSMQLAVVRSSCETPCLLVYNYVVSE